MSEGYSYTSIVSGTGEPVRIDVSFYLDDTAWVRACGLGKDRPQLAIRHGDVAASFHPTPDAITRTDARLARELASQAAQYAAEVERLFAEQQADAHNDAAA